MNLAMKYEVHFRRETRDGITHASVEVFGEDETQERPGGSYAEYEVSTSAEMLQAFVCAVIEERCNPRAVHEAMLFIPEYRAAVPLSPRGERYCGLAWQDEK